MMANLYRERVALALVVCLLLSLAGNAVLLKRSAELNSFMTGRYFEMQLIQIEHQFLSSNKLLELCLDTPDTAHFLLAKRLYGDLGVMFNYLDVLADKFGLNDYVILPDMLWSMMAYYSDYVISPLILEWDESDDIEHREYIIHELSQVYQELVDVEHFLFRHEEGSELKQTMRPDLTSLQVEETIIAILDLLDPDRREAVIEYHNYVDNFNERPLPVS